VNFTQIGTTAANVTAFSDTTAAAGMTYHYRVVAANGNGASAPSNSVSTTTIPSAPTGLIATVISATQVNLSWNNVPGETGYTVQRSTNGTTWNNIGTTAANVVTFSDTTASAGTTYQYRVVASNAAGSSAPSASVSATTIPAAPTLTATAINATRIDLSWTNVAGETGYVIERSPNGSSGWTQIGTTGVNVTTFQNTGLQFSTMYFYRVRAQNGSGQSVNSNTASATTPIAPPAAPTGLVATALSQSQIRLTWNDVYGETQYVIERSSNGTNGWSQVGTTSANTTTFTNTGLKKNTRYYYRIRAVNAAGSSPNSAVVNATTLR
jgi:titin